MKLTKQKKIALAVGLLLLCVILALLALQSCAPASAPSEEMAEETVVEKVAVPTVSGITADALSLVTNGEATANLNAAVTGTDTDTVVFWYSASNDSIVVDTAGNVTALEKTNVTPFVTIMAKYDANGDGVAAEDEATLKSIKVAVNVSTVLESISVEAASSDLVAYPYTGAGGEDKITLLTVTANPTGTAATGIAFASSDEGVVTVDEYGNVAAVNAGTATITATCAEGFAASCELTVTRADSDVQAQADAEAAAAAKAAAEAAAAQAAAEAAAAQAAAEAAAAQAAADAAAAQAATDAAAAQAASTESSSTEGYQVYIGPSAAVNGGDAYMFYNGGDDGLVDPADNGDMGVWID